MITDIISLSIAPSLCRFLISEYPEFNPLNIQFQNFYNDVKKQLLTDYLSANTEYYDFTDASVNKVHEIRYILLLDYSEKFGLKKREKIIKIKLNLKYLLYY
jgi:hypothetical protein